MSKRVILVFCDAFSSRYLNAELSAALYTAWPRTGLFKLQSMLGYHSIGAAIYAGAWPNETDVLAQYLYDPKRAKDFSSSSTALLTITDYLPSGRALRWSRRLIFRLSGKPRADIENVIPGRYLRYFWPAFTSSLTEPGCLTRTPTIYDVLVAHGRTYTSIDAWPQAEAKTIKRLIDDLQSDALPDLTELHVSSLDYLGHEFGPESDEVRDGVLTMSRNLTKLLQAVQRSQDVSLVIASDHGMVPVRQLVDIEAALRKLPIRPEVDYLYFLDSTMARFWFLKPQAEQIVLQMLDDLPGGHVFSMQEKIQLRIDKLSSEWGHVIYALDDGNVIFPDFFRRRTPPKGMHGYAWNQYDSPVLMLYIPGHTLSSQAGAEPRHIDIMPTVLEFMELPVPSSCQGRSLIQHS